MKEKYTRKFLGELNYSNESDKMKRAFHKKHLDAYVKGHDRFIFGIDNDGKPVFYNVQFKLIKIPNEQQG